MVVIPQQAEQAMTARRIVELGLGVALDPEQLTEEQLREAVEQVYADEALYERVQTWKQIVRGAGGGSQAAEAIIAFARKHTSMVSVS
jgi:NDP-glycosyltransferase